MNIAIRKVFSVAMLIFASHADATLVFEDWKADSDNLVTKDTISGLEWLNFSQATIGHQAIRNSLHDVYDGFRFATTEELLGLFLNYVPQLSPTGFMFGTDAQIAADLQTVFDSLGYDDDIYSFVNTCVYPTGCDPLGFDAGDGISRNILSADPVASSFAVWFRNDNDFAQVQALVRIPEPTTAELLALGLIGMAGSALWQRRLRHAR